HIYNYYYPVKIFLNKITTIIQKQLPKNTIPQNIKISSVTANTKNTKSALSGAFCVLILALQY
ncbi:MAG: hypothetical protein RR141_05045, partial [Rikenellaceae bacterium]